MRIVPDSTITLYGGVDIDNGEQLVFKSRANQTAYFQSKLVRAQTPCTVVRKTGRLRVEIAGSVIATCNYLSFINPSFDNKIVYARIIDYDYINNECVEISYAIDYWQTWMFDVTFENMYIEREHLSQADFAKAETNPYDPTIFEFKTAETLPIAEDLEKKMYTIGNNDTYDGFKVGEAIEALDPHPAAQNNVGVLIKLAEIDFEDMDSQTPAGQLKPSEQFSRYLDNIEHTALGCFYLPPVMATYLHGLYPNIVSASGEYCGTGWTAGGTALTPFTSSSFLPGCVLIYDQDGGNFSAHNGYISQLLTLLAYMGATDQIIAMNAIPNNIMLYAGKPNGTAENIKIGQKTMKTKINVTNKKLMRYPFSYLKVITPNGDVKELHFEDFKEVQEGNDVCKIAIGLDVSDQPTLIAAPYKYKMTGLSRSVMDDANVLEGLVFAQFPTTPYTIDAWAAQIGATAVNTIAGRTIDAGADLANESVNVSRMSAILKTAQMGVGGAGIDTSAGISSGYNNKGVIQHSPSASMGGSMIGVIGGAVNTAANARAYGAELETERIKYENAAAMWGGADSALAGGDYNAITNNLALAKPAYACNKYYMSNGSGVINFNYLSFIDIVVLRAQLNSDILAVYDYYFSQFGYTSGRCGIPRVINYMHGDTAQADIPAWATVNNKPTTYIKTMDCKVIHSMIPVASFIKNMFDSGVRMIQGDANG